MVRTPPCWFNCMTEHWNLPQRLDLTEYVRRGTLQRVQAGTFGPQFCGLAEGETVLTHEEGEGRVWFSLPSLIVYGSSVGRLRRVGP